MDRSLTPTEEVDAGQLLGILLRHLDRIEDDLRLQLGDAGARWRTTELYRRKRAESPKASERTVVEEMVTQVALVHLDEAFFRILCEERKLPDILPFLRGSQPRADDTYLILRPCSDTVAALVSDLSAKSFVRLSNEQLGNLHQGLLSSRRRSAASGSGGGGQQARLGAFYTPSADVAYMVSKLGLTADSRVLDPCMGSGHFLEGIYEALLALRLERGDDPAAAHREIVSRQLYGGDVDRLAATLAAIRMLLRDEHGTGARPNLFVGDTLLPSPLDGVELDAVVGNPPYGAHRPDGKRSAYARLYGAREADRRRGSLGTGDRETYSMFFASAIERLREGGRLCLITNDSFRTLTTHAALRRHILDSCKIVEILLTDSRHFEGVGFHFAGMAITTLEKCSDAQARKENAMRLVDRVRDPAGFADPDPALVIELRQEDYEALAGAPFFVGVPVEVVEAAKGSARIADVARGRVGLQTGDDRRFLAGIGTGFPGLEKVAARDGLAAETSAMERARGIAASRPHWVPFAKGEGFGEYWRDPQVAIDWSRSSVRELERRAALAAGTARKAYIRNRDSFFRPALTYSVISSGRISARLMPEGWVFGHKGSAIFPEEGRCSQLFLLGYLNSALATYFMRKMVNTTATADIGYVEKLPYREPPAALEREVEKRAAAIIERLKTDPEADVGALRAAIDERIFDLFEIHRSREAVLRFHAAGAASN